MAEKEKISETSATKPSGWHSYQAAIKMGHEAHKEHSDLSQT